MQAVSKIILLSDKSEIDEVDNDINLGAIAGARNRKKPNVMAAR